VQQFAASPPVRQAQEWALENLSADLSVKALAKRAGISERSFRRAFVEKTGEAPRDFVERIRIDAARSLFEEAQLSVQVVLRL
jgi:transcriptional regulator GlxA family with amidase domain